MEKSLKRISKLEKENVNLVTQTKHRYLASWSLTIVHVQVNKQTNKQTSKQTTRGVLLKKVFLEISKNSQESTCARVSFLA